MLDTTELLLGVYELSGNIPRRILLLRLKKALQREFQSFLCRLQQKGGLEMIGLSGGGVAYNDHITSVHCRNG